MRGVLRLSICALVFGIAVPVVAKDRMDSALRAEIARIAAIDNHTHADPVSARRGSGWHLDSPLGSPPYPDVAQLRRDDPQWIRAWKALYGYKYTDFATDHLAELLAEKQRRLAAEGSAWPTKVLDAAGVQVAFVNAPHLGAGQQTPRFRWVPFADPLLAPFLGDRPLLEYPGGPVTLADLLREGDIAVLPRTLDEYLSRVVERTLTRWASLQVPAVKFLSAYRRGLDFDVVPTARAALVYERGAAGQTLSSGDQKGLEDYLFVELSARAAEHHLVVHIHTGNGNGPYFNNAGANPALLESALNSGRLRKARVVLLHGGWPYPLVTQAMLDKPNTYADFSAETFYLTTHALAEVLRGWLEWHPEKVLFGTDAYSDENTPLSDYEEKQWLLTDKSRDAVAIALTAMVDDGELTRSRAVEIAKMVFRENAVQLYGLSRDRLQYQSSRVTSAPNASAFPIILSILGTWTGTWKNVNNIQTGTESFVVQTQTGSTITGFFCWDITQDPATCSSNINDYESWTGTIDATGTLVVTGQLGDYRGRLSRDGTSISGTYQNRRIASHTGTWAVQRAPRNPSPSDRRPASLIPSGW